MIPPADLQRITPQLLFSQAYDRTIKSDLCSTAITAGACTLLVDPVPMTDRALNELRQIGVAGIVVTNANHLRASKQHAACFDVPIYARREVLIADPDVAITEISDATEICPGVSALFLDGAGPGELVVYAAQHGGTLVVGDALINFEPYGFALLPRKYCLDQKQMQHSLQKLLDYRFEKMLFAHGTPILSRGAARLRQLLECAA